MTDEAQGTPATEPLRVLFVTRKWRPATGGMENYSHELTDAIAASCDLSVRALPGKANGMPPSIRLQMAFFLRSIAHIAFNAHRFDVLHIGDLLLWPLALAGRIGSRHVRTIVSAHGTDIAYPLRSGLLPRLYAAYLRVGAICSRSTAVIANSTATAALCRDAGFAVAGTVPLGVRMREVPESVLPVGDYVLFVGRLVRRKGCSWFIREVLPRLDERIRLKVAGTEWDHDESAALACERVDYLGSVYGQELAELRQAALVVVVPNMTCKGRDFEGFGLTATEAAADGGIVLASRVDGLADAIVDGISGFLLPPEDAREWASKIDEVAHWTPRQRQSFIRQSREMLARHYTWERVAADTLTVYNGRPVANRLIPGERD